MNTLFYGDNLDVLERHIEDETVDLIYLDPPFNSNATYSILFDEPGGRGASEAQIRAFDDTWQWGPAAERAFDMVLYSGTGAAILLDALRTAIGQNALMAYLCNMSVRLLQLHRKLRSTGSLYLHCDPTASHYLKIILDSIFGPSQYRSEIIWKRSSAHSDTRQGRKIHGHIHDTILFYTKSNKWKWNPVFTEYDADYIENFYRYTEEKTGRRFRLDNLTAAKPGGDTEYDWRTKRKFGGLWQGDLTDEWRNPKKGFEYKGIPPYRNRYWAYSRDNMKEYERTGRLVYSSNGFPSYKRYLDEMPGVPLQDVWTDIRPIGSRARERMRMRYPTQKPLALLERIIESSTDLGDIILDPFCGCGTSIHAAQKLGRKWLGIDIAYVAIDVVETRLRVEFPQLKQGVDYKISGIPSDLTAARVLANEDPFEFQWWAVSQIEGRPIDRRRGPDKGIDGIVDFLDGRDSLAKAIVSVKSGKRPGPAAVRELTGTVQHSRSKAGILITLEAPTHAMYEAARDAGRFKTDFGTFERIQILSADDLLKGTKPSLPVLIRREDRQRFAGRKKARVRGPDGKQMEFKYTIAEAHQPQVADIGEVVALPTKRAARRFA